MFKISIKSVFFLFSVIVTQIINAQQPPIETISRVADKVLRDVRFHYNLKLANSSDYGNVETLNFGRNYSDKNCAYALTTIDSPKDTTFFLSIANYGACRIMLNGEIVWKHEGMHPDDFQYIERDYLITGSVRLSVKKGINRLLIKSEAPDIYDWKIHLRPLGFQFSLAGLKEVEKSLSDISRWLMIGTYPKAEFDKIESVEKEFVSGKMYSLTNNREITWILPRLEIVAANAQIHQPWDEGYTAFNYHAAGLAMAMEMLGQYSKKQQYTNYSRKYCDFYIEKREYLSYQKFKLNAFNAWDHKVVKGCLLDFSSAPMLPYAEVLLNTPVEKRDSRYLDFFNEMKEYVVNHQTRTPDRNFNRINPRKFTIWVDDMYMGLPFLVQAARLSESRSEQKQLIDDAINQVFSFNKYVWNEDVKLYQHGQYTDSIVRMPHWSRGNGWALWAVTSLLANAPKNHPRYKDLLSHYHTHVDALIAHQDESGLWRNVIDNPKAFLETSGTAIFTLCITRGIRNGWLNKDKYTPVVLKAWKGIETMVGNENEVYGITIGTNCTTDVNYYLERETCVNDAHGLFPLIIAGIEVDKLINNK